MWLSVLSCTATVYVISIQVYGQLLAEAFQDTSDPLLPTGLACTPPTPLSKTGPNVMMIGDSISMGSSGYSYFVQDMLQTASGGTLAGSVQHGGGFGAGGQMASSTNGVMKVRDCIGNATGTLPPKAWSVITYNAGLHDCDKTERVLPAAYAANLKAVFETLLPAASAVVFVDTTPYPVNSDGSDPLPGGLHMECVLQYNAIAKQVAADVGLIILDDLHGYVEQFCGEFPKAPAGSLEAKNYTKCALQPGHQVHFFTHAPLPSGQQYTALSVAESIVLSLPNAEIRNTTTPNQLTRSDEGTLETMACGDPPAPLNKSVPNVLVIGDSISEAGSGYFPAVKEILEHPTDKAGFLTGALAAAQHNGGNGANQAGPSTNGAACIHTWLGEGGWDVITMNFGLHDCCPGGDGRPAGQIVNKTEYIRNLGSIYDAASAGLADGGKILFVTTTPIAVGQSTSGTCGLTGQQYNSCIDDYNAAARALLSSKSDVEIVDLNSAVNKVCGVGYSTCNLQRFANMHFTDAGKQFCAVIVAKALAPFLAPKWNTLTKATEGVLVV